MQKLTNKNNENIRYIGFIKQRLFQIKFPKSASSYKSPLNT